MTLSNINVTRWNNDGPEVLLVHGGPQGGPQAAADHFADQQPLAARGWQLILPDRPGHGASPTRGPEDMEVDAQWVAEMLGDGMHLVGHSYGGAVALAAAAQRPDAVKSLTLIEPATADIAIDDPRVVTFRETMRETIDAGHDPLGMLMAYAQMVVLPPDMRGPAPTMDDIQAMGAALMEMRQPIDWDALSAVYAVRDAGMPVLVVTGAGMPAFEAMGDEIARITAGERIVIPVGHHFPQYDGDTFNHALHDFLTSVEARSRGVA
jgi:pimeloyl-ACP methyl ester carboxylesterase